MLTRIILAVIVAVVVYLVCIFVGGVILTSLGVPIAVKVGEFLNQWAGAISVLAGLWYFFSGGSFSFRR